MFYIENDLRERYRMVIKRHKAGQSTLEDILIATRAVSYGHFHVYAAIGNIYRGFIEDVYNLLDSTFENGDGHAAEWNILPETRSTYFSQSKWNVYDSGSGYLRLVENEELTKRLNHVVRAGNLKLMHRGYISDTAFTDALIDLAGYEGGYGKIMDMFAFIYRIDKTMNKYGVKQ